MYADDMAFCEETVNQLDEIWFMVRKRKDELIDNEKLDIVDLCEQIINYLKNEVIS